jgi:tetratricopeptide (TPR) repeat protein
MSEEPKAARGWFTEFRRRRMFRAMVAYLVGAWLLLQVANVTFPPLGVPDWVQRAMIIALAIGIVPAFVLAWIFDLTVHGIVRTDAVVRADAESAHAADADASFHPLPRTAAAEQPGPAHAVAASPQPETGASVAILPFADLSAAKDQDWFCDGLAEEIIDALSCVRGLRVASRTASFRFRDGSVDPREIGTQLRVGAILEGSVRKSASVAYYRAADRCRQRLSPVVGDFRSPPRGRLCDPVEIARRVSAALRVVDRARVAARIERYATRNMRAHEFYLRGRQLVRRVGVLEWRQSPAMFRRAIELDPEYAAAHAGLADVLAQLLLWRFVKAEDVLPEATSAAHRALELAPELAEAHVALGHVRSLTGDIDGAARSFERAKGAQSGTVRGALLLRASLPGAWQLRARCRAVRVGVRLRPDDFTVPALCAGARPARQARGGGCAGARYSGWTETSGRAQSERCARSRLSCRSVRAARPARGDSVEAAMRAPPTTSRPLYNAACYYSLAG